MIEKAKKKGIYENFGQDEIRKLKDKYNYNALLKSDDCLSKKEIIIRDTIDELNQWAMNYTN